MNALLRSLLWAMRRWFHRDPWEAMDLFSELSVFQRTLYPAAIVFYLWRAVSSPHLLAALAYEQASSHSIKRKPWGRKKTCAGLKWDAVSVTLSLPGTIHYSCIWNQKPVLWGTKNARYNFPDVLLERNSPSLGSLCSEVSISPMASIICCL